MPRQTHLRRLLLSVAFPAADVYPPSRTPERSGYPPDVATAKRDDDEKRDLRAQFDDAVTMTAARLRTWLETDESRSVGDSGGQLNNV